MPELPEVETVRRGLERYLPGQRLRKVTLRREDLRWPIPVDAVRDLEGRRCVSITRRSKYLQLEFGGKDKPIALVHLGMSGRAFVDDTSNPPYETHEHWRMDFGKCLLRYVDARRFGMLDVVTKQGLPTHRLLQDLGPEPLSNDFHGDYLFALSRRRKVATKTFLMDAGNVVGIGNIYASEACFRAGVRPRRMVSRLTQAECKALARACKEVLRDAIAQGGTTIRDYISVDENFGYFQQSLAVYGRAKEPCPRCGAPVKRIVQTGRASYYCAGCQR